MSAESSIACRRVSIRLGRIMWRIITFPILKIIIAVILVNVPTFLLRNMAELILSALHVTDKTFVSCIVFVVRIVTVYFAYLLFVRIFERRKAIEISFSNTTIKDFFLGGVYGLLSFSITALIILLTGMCSISSVNENPTLLTNFFFDFFFAFLQDIVYFAIIFRITEKYLGTFISIFIAGVIFGFKHLLFPDYTIWGAIAISLEGAILFTALFIISRNIWMVFGFHFAWNYLANGIFGLVKLEGIQSLLNVEISGPEILAGSRNGIESSVIALAVSLFIGIPYLMIAYRRGNFIRPFWKRLDKRRQKRLDHVHT